MIKQLLIIGVGGFFGSILRYYISAVSVPGTSGFPTGTFIVNLAGSLLIGILAALLIKEYDSMKFLLITGFCGGFTTFSTFSLENLTLVKNGNWQAAIIYTTLSILGGVFLAGTGYFLTQKLV